MATEAYDRWDGVRTRHNLAADEVISEFVNLTWYDRPGAMKSLL
jgi:hypothetical protein